MEKDEFVRIKKDISPYGGKKVRVAGVEKLPNGRVVIRVHAPTKHKSGWMHTDIREYDIHEVEKV